MNFGRIADGRIAVIEGRRFWDISDLTRGYGQECSMVALISNFDALKDRIGPALSVKQPASLDEVRLGPPLGRPSKVVAIPSNYGKHIREMGGDAAPAAVEMFLKAPSAIVGPGQEILLPRGAGRVDHEAELVIVIGKKACSVSIDEALDYVFGYTCGLDVTVRGPGDRSMRKSYDTFAPLGPWITLKADVPNPDSLSIRFSINDEVRQLGSTRDMIFNCAQLISGVSRVMTLEPGDVIFTGTPDGVSPLRAGDRLRIDIESIGGMQLTVGSR